MTQLNIISLGAGRQSTAMALMAAHGEIEPMPDAALFADTGDEPAWVYETIKWLKSGNVLPFPIITVSNGKLSKCLFEGDDEARIPYFVKPSGLGGRQCTRNYKIYPIRRQVRKLLGIGPHSYVPPGAVSQWIGISRDEAARIKPSGVKFVVNRWPLIEKFLTVSDCKRWLTDNGYPIPWSSACVYCPFLDDAARARIRDYDPAGHALAIKVDNELRTLENIKRFRGSVYIHKSRQPLEQVDFNNLWSGKGSENDQFNNECEGMCGV